MLKMLTQRIILKSKLPQYSYAFTYIRKKCYSTKAEVNPNVEFPLELRLPTHKLKIRQRQPFAKNFFLGKYDTEFAAFPEPQTHDRHKEFFEWLKPIEEYVESSIDNDEIDRTGKIPSEVMEDLKSLGVFRAPVPDEYGGLGLNTSEYAKLVETLSPIPALGAYFAKRDIPINLISTLASDEQKALYLSRISNGKYMPTLCISEDLTGSEGSTISTQVSQSDCQKYWILNGTKTYVVNGDNANLFIVFAEYSEGGQSCSHEDTISPFFVERSFGGITVEPPAKTLGLHGLSFCKVNFQNTKIPIENIIGEIGLTSEAFTSIFSNGKHNIGAQAIGITKRYLEILIRHLKGNKDFNAVQFKNDSVQEVIGKICCSIYGMESILYLTTGIIDTVMDQDCNLEKCIVESYCVDTCIKSIVMGTHVLGLSSQLEGSGAEQLLRDAMCLTAMDGMKSDIHTVIAVNGIQYMAAGSTGKLIQKLKNPWSHPSAVLKSLFSREKFTKLYIADYLHPTLQTTANLIEESIKQFKASIKEVLLMHGILICERQMVLRRISEVASYLYVMAAIVARSSRSYCLGMRESEKELEIAQIFGYMLYGKVQELIRELNDGTHLTGDALIKNIADKAFENDKYWAAHPLERNF